jgi:hypothetical protein
MLPTDTRTVAQLTATLTGTMADAPTVYVWRGATYSGGVWTEDDAPTGGDSVSMGALDMCRWDGTPHADEGPVFMEVPCTAWSDYSGGAVERSNARSLRRDFPDEVVTVTGGYSTEFLVLPADGTISEALFNAIAGLAEYPLFDEEDLSELEQEILAEDWESWGESDVLRILAQTAEDACPDCDEGTCEVDHADGIDRDRAREAFFLAAEGYGFTAVSSDVANHAERAAKLYARTPGGLIDEVRAAERLAR